MLSAAITGTLGGFIAVATGFAVVAGAFFLAMLSLWFLKSKLGVQVKATVTGEAQAAAGRFRIITDGPAGYFFALVILALGALYFVVTFVMG